MRTNRDPNSSTSSISSRKASTIKKNQSLCGLTASTPKGSKSISIDSDDFYDSNTLDSHRSTNKKLNSSIKIDLNSIKKDAMSKEKSGVKPTTSNRKSVVQLQTGPGSIVMNDWSNLNFDTVNK